jgi:flagella basal body P-ring formation protein FlgA
LAVVLAACGLTAHATVANANASLNATTFELLQHQVLQWAATHPGLQGRTLHVVPLDNRIVLQACQQKLQFEQPFVNQPNVRVRCAQPQWQLFVTLGNGATPPSAKTDTPAAAALVKVLVAKEVLKRGTIISPDMFVLTEMPASGMENQIIADPQLVVNMELVRDLAPNAPLRTFDLKKAVMVKRGQEVQVTAGAGQGFLITMRAEALQEGALGEQIRLKNSESGRSLTAVVTGQNTARLK